MSGDLDLGYELGLKEGGYDQGYQAGRKDALRKIKQLFSGGPDTPCRTTWRPEDGLYGEIIRIECVEVPLEELREALS